MTRAALSRYHDLAGARRGPDPEQGGLRTGPKGATFLACRKAIQEPVARLLEEWGDAPRPSASRRPRTRTIEHDLRSVLAGLSDDFPLIASLIRAAFGRSEPVRAGWAGGRRRARTSVARERRERLRGRAGRGAGNPSNIRRDDDALGRLVESTIWVNEAHPAYRRALASRSEGYHVAATVALILAPLAVEAARVQEFVTAFLAPWGGAGIGGRKGGT